ncbi:MAG: DUF1828 domain-containing protein [Candidatus Cloacimonadaceae bacterium]|jgi:hypothetical protein|nr:DUF1828 domain-containing protein [Candidatus Cloacimonadaceae bacterium]
MMIEAKKLVDNYALWLKESTDLRQVEKYVEITTPFLDRHNDHIQLYLSKEDESFILTDDGYTLSDLSISGCEVDTEKRKQLLTQTLNGFGVTRIGDALTVKTDLTRFAQKKHNLLQAILSVNDLFYTASPLVLSLFLEDVQAWLDKNEIRYTPNISFIGKSGFSHNYEFVIPKSKAQPERILKVLSNPDRNVIQSLLFSWQDTALIRPQNAHLYAFLNDSAGLKESHIEAIGNYGISGVQWSKREKYAKALAS